MTVRTPPSVDDLIAELSALGDLRVWSVIITIFGDSVLPRGGLVAATTLAQITERLSIKPEALRVALYRLARDGWIRRSKEGRNSYYRLSAKGVDEFAPATRRIYAERPAMHGPWQLAAAKPAPKDDRAELDQKMEDAGYKELAPCLFLGAAGAVPPCPNLILVEGDRLRIPPWVRERLGPEELNAEFTALGGTLGTCLAALKNAAPPAPLDAITLRTLIIHQWRRLLLRHPDLPPEFFPGDWTGEACRAHVQALLGLLAGPAEAWLDEAFAATRRSSAG